MGIRAHAVIKYKKEFGDCLGFNYDYEGFCEFMEKLDIGFFASEDINLVEINTKELLSLRTYNLELDEEETEILLTLQKNAKRAGYARDNYFRVEWL